MLDGDLDAEDFEVWIENWQSLNVFLACATQWRILVGMGGMLYQGIDYQALVKVIDLLKIRDASTIFNDIQKMEAAAVTLLNQQQANSR